MTKLTYRPLALEDLDTIADITGTDYPERGFAFVEAIMERCRVNLPDNPEMGRARPDLGEGIRIYPIKSKRTIVAYRVRAEDISIVRVFYGGADYEATLKKED